MAAVIGLEPLPKDTIGNGLQPRIHRRSNYHSAFVKGVFAEPVNQLAPDLLGEVVGSNDVGRRPAVQGQRRRPRLFRLLGGDAAILEHAPEDPVAAAFGGGRITVGVVIVGCLGKGREKGRFRYRQFVEGLVEVVEGGGDHAVGPVPQVDLVEIEFEDALLGERLLHPKRQDRLLDLAVQGNLVAEKEVLGHLLGDGRRADQSAARAEVSDVGDGGADDAQHVDAGMGVEVLVLGGQERMDQRFGNDLDRNEDPIFDRVLGKQTSISRIDPGHDRRRVVRKLRVIRKAFAEMLKSVYDTDDAEHRGDRQQPEQSSDNSQHQSALTAVPVRADPTDSVQHSTLDPTSAQTSGPGRDRISLRR